MCLDKNLSGAEPTSVEGSQGLATEQRAKEAEDLRRWKATQELQSRQTQLQHETEEFNKWKEIQKSSHIQAYQEPPDFATCGASPSLSQRQSISDQQEQLTREELNWAEEGARARAEAEAHQQAAEAYSKTAGAKGKTRAEPED
jgi:hypothetical protein